MGEDDHKAAPPPQPASTPLERVVERVMEGGLPEVIAGPAGKAISRLIGGAADIPAAWLEQRAQAIRDDTAARSEVIKAMSGAVSRNILENPELLERAQATWLGKAYRGQVNREAIAAETVMLLAENPAKEEAAEPSADWMNIFETYAENATSEKLRSTWAQVLAGEIRRPKSYSLRTLQFIATLDAETAKAFEFVSRYVVQGSMIVGFEKYNFTSEFSNLLNIREAGLAGDALVSRGMVIDDQFILVIESYLILIPAGGRQNVDIPNTPLTKVGKELYAALNLTASKDSAAEVANFIANMIGSNDFKIVSKNDEGVFRPDDGETITTVKYS